MRGLVVLCLPLRFPTTTSPGAAGANQAISDNLKLLSNFAVLIRPAVSLYRPVYP